MASNSELQLVREHGWFHGFTNLFVKENRRWWKTSYWLIQLIIWLVVVNGLLIVFYAANDEIIISDEQAPTSAELQIKAEMEQFPERIGVIAFLDLIGSAAAIGLAIIAQEAVLRERQSGTAAWVLSKPVSRSAFIFAKLAGFGLGILSTMVLIVGAVAYGEIYWITGVAIPILPYIGMLSLAFLLLFFYLSLSIMVSTIFNSRGAVIGIPLILVVGYDLLLSVFPWLVNIMPWNLVHSFERPSSALAIMEGYPLPTWSPVIWTIVWCLIFITIAILKFDREEF